MLLAIFAGSLIAAAARMTAELLSGRHDEELRAPRPEPVRAPHRKGSFLVGPSLMAFSGIATLLVLEVVFRTFFPQPLYAVRFAPWGFWHMENICLVHGSAPRNEGRILRGTEFITTVCYNSVGMREREVSLEKPADTGRILVLGDSYGEGLEVEYEETVGQVLERLLNGGARATSAPFPTATLAPIPSPLPLAGPDWAVTRAVFGTLNQNVRADGARLLVANVHYQGEGFAIRRAFFEGEGIAWVDVALRDLASEVPTFHYRYDGHWNATGHARAAELIAAHIRQERYVESFERVEVLNASMSAYSTCKELAVYQNIGRAFDPDVVLVVYTAADERNLEDLDVCRPSEGIDRVTLHDRIYSPLQHFLRVVRSAIRANSHFGAWVLDGLGAVPFLNDLRFRLTEAEEPIRYVDPAR